jgi:hypothetical protein
LPPGPDAPGVEVFAVPAEPSAWIVPAMDAVPKTTSITAWLPVKLNVVPDPIVSDWRARTSIVGPPLGVTVLTLGNDWPHVAPDQLVPLKVTVPEQVRLTAATGVSPAS